MTTVLCLPNLELLFQKIRKNSHLGYQIDEIINTSFANLTKDLPESKGKSFVVNLYKEHKSQNCPIDVHSILMLNSDQQLIAFAQIWRSDQSSDYFLVNFCRHAKKTQKGLGKIFMKYILRYAKCDMGLSILYLETTLWKLLQYYQDLGWKVNRKPFANDSIFEMFYYL